jgi:hypothetical protein
MTFLHTNQHHRAAHGGGAPASSSLDRSEGGSEPSAHLGRGQPRPNLAAQALSTTFHGTSASQPVKLLLKSGRCGPRAAALDLHPSQSNAGHTFAPIFAARRASAGDISRFFDSSRAQKCLI